MIPQETFETRLEAFYRYNHILDINVSKKAIVLTIISEDYQDSVISMLYDYAMQLILIDNWHVEIMRSFHDNTLVKNKSEKRKEELLIKLGVITFKIQNTFRISR